MMASIPTTRSTPLPVPARTPPAGETVPGEFAAQMPAVRGQPIAATPSLPELPVELAIPVPADGETPDDGAPETKAEAPEAKADVPGTDGQPQPAIVIPIVQHLPAAPGPQAPLTVTADFTASPEAAETNAQPVLATPVGRRTCGTGGDKTSLPLPAVPEMPEKTPATRAVEAAVKELLQRKALPDRPQVAAAPKTAPAETAKAEAAPVASPAKTQMPAPTPPVAIQTSAPLPTAELPQPVLSALSATVPQPAPAATDKAGSVEGTRSTDLAVERRLDLARDTEWLDRLARDIARAGSNDGPLRFRLHPQTLGSLHVELQQGDHGTAVRLTVETEAARQILADAQPRLAAEARAQGVRIAETHVDLSGSGRHAPGDQRRQDEARSSPLIRTARGAGTEVLASARSSGRARPDRYA